MIDLVNTKFYVIQSWMVSFLKLSGLDLLVYAIIYGYSQDGDSEFFGSLNYLAEMTGSTKRGVIKSLQSLTAKEYIIRRELTISNIKHVRYKVNIKAFSGSELSSSVVNKVHQSGEKTSPNNIIYNIDLDIYKGPGGNKLKQDFDSFWKAYPKHTNTSKKEAFKKFCKAMEKTDIETILAAIENQKKTKQWIDGYIPMATTWLNQEKWDDEVEVFKPKEKKETKRYTEDETPWKAANWLSRKLKSVHPSLQLASEETLQAWASVFNTMEAMEGHPADEILSLMKFAFQDEFWKDKITNPWDMQKHYIKLLAKAEGDGWFK